MNPLDSTETLLKLTSEIASLFKDTAKKDEVLELFKMLTSRIASIKEEIERQIRVSGEDVGRLGEEVSGKIANSEYTLLTKMESGFVELREVYEKRLNERVGELTQSIQSVQRSIPDIPEQEDYSSIFTRINSQIAELQKLTSGENVRNALEALPEGEKLAINAVGSLREELDELKKIKVTQAGNGIAFREFVTKYDLSPSLDGVTKTFNIPGTYAILSVACSSFPSILRPTIDYTHTQSTITFTSEIEASTTLAAGQTVIIMLINA